MAQRPTDTPPPSGDAQPPPVPEDLQRQLDEDSDADEMWRHTNEYIQRRIGDQLDRDERAITGRPAPAGAPARQRGAGRREATEAALGLLITRLERAQAEAEAALGRCQDERSAYLARYYARPPDARGHAMPDIPNCDEQRRQLGRVGDVLGRARERRAQEQQGGRR
jgi:hypothetical protein